ncbi:MAG: Hsp20/alpha crystallin family protein [Thiobacillus sp.]
MMARTLFPRDLFAELDRLQRGMQQRIDMTPSIRGLGRDGFPAINVGGTPQSVELYAFAPGVDPASLDVQVEKGVLTIAGERKPDTPQPDVKATLHIEERFAGRFRRVVSLPDDVDAAAIEARYRNGVLHISIPRQQAAQPRRIQIQSGDQS